MLLLISKIGVNYYGIDTNHVEEVIPYIELSHWPGGESNVVGAFEYRGEFLPVIDLKKHLTQEPSERKLSTRIALVKIDGHANEKVKFGVIAENMVSTLDVSGLEEVKETFSEKEHTFLGKMFHLGEDVLQIILLNALWAGGKR